MTIPEKKWKAFKSLRSDALQRHCQTTLDEAKRICSSAEQTAHDRYLELYAYIDKRDHEIDAIFDTLRRSQAKFQLYKMHDQGLITDEQFQEFVEAD